MTSGEDRPGRTSTNPDGYLDAGLSNVVFADAASNGDIHNYQLVLNPNGSALTGTWQPDARNVNPATATDAAARSAFLSAFNGADAHGSWTLFIADFAAGGQGTCVEPSSKNLSLCRSRVTQTRVGVDDFAFFRLPRAGRRVYTAHRVAAFIACVVVAQALLATSCRSFP